jgi:hypothetical protein
MRPLAETGERAVRGTAEVHADPELYAALTAD